MSSNADPEVCCELLRLFSGCFVFFFFFGGGGGVLGVARGIGLGGLGFRV